ncbi:ABC transporter ATP-binding protein [Corynebacterium auris]|uniref:ABC transporter ATP-binding protein n=1 Tax=Corynebacterium auris TaxID=44750 RepID=UPI0025B35984|nr:ABC transporter ATP-binding protein [Corynebacterium auris]WJY68229.1 Oligopeptide transport ATP-binding protein OppF [Corynebacterium auris]
MNATPPHATASEPIIALENISVRFKSRTGPIFRPNWVDAVTDVSLSVMPGETIGIVGESGCGKSTTANVMCGLQAPTSGTVRFNGRDVTSRSAEERRAMGRVVSVVFQDPSTALNGRMTVKEQLLDPLRVHDVGTKQEREERVHELLRLVGLPEAALGALPGQLSGGQRQRVAIARALALNPEVIIADEPTSSLDVSVRAQILNLFNDLKADLGLSMVFISHDIQTVRYISDRICVMRGGRIIEEGEAARVFAEPRDPYTRKLLSASPSLLHPAS